MKRTLFFTILCALSFSFRPSSGIDDVIISLGKGGASSLARYFDESIDMTIADRSGSYSKSQAQMVLRDFFNSHPVLGFEISQKGGSGDRQFCNGKLLTSKGNFRTSIQVRLRAGRPVIREIRIEKN